jgi:hypothetical protein
MTRTRLTTDPGGLHATGVLGRQARIYPYLTAGTATVRAHVSLVKDPGFGSMDFDDHASGYDVTGGTRADLTAYRDAVAAQAQAMTRVGHPQATRDLARVEALDALLAASTCPAGINPDVPCYADPQASVCTCTPTDA